jgi:hypothetical protein
MFLAIPTWDVSKAEFFKSGAIKWHFMPVETALLGIIAFAMSEPVGAVFLDARGPTDWQSIEVVEGWKIRSCSRR